MSTEIEGFIISEEIDIPESFDFSVSDTCSGHACFEQISAREDGSFIVYSMLAPQKMTYEEVNEMKEEIYSRKFIDFYDADGRFIQEISFISKQNCAVKLTENTINIYFYSDKIIVYDLRTQELYNYLVVDQDSLADLIIASYKQTDFVSGEWNYHYHKSLFGECTKITRQNNVLEQVLVEAPGTNYSTLYIILPFVISILVISAIVKRKRKQHKGGGDV